MSELRIPDFLTLGRGGPWQDETALRREDLAVLRQCVRRRTGTESGGIISKVGRKRLIAHGMLTYRDGLTFATPYGVEVARANASCIDGSEGLPTTAIRRAA